jgi:cytochrome c oxidase subunit 2
MRRIGAASLLIVLPLTAGCSALPLSYLDADSPIGGKLAQLGWGLLAIAVIVIVIIAILLVWAIARGRSSPDGDALAVRRDAGGMRWIYIGVSISTVALVASVIWTLLTLRAVAEPAKSAPMTIEIRARQWWWDAIYRAPRPDHEFSTANEIHIPVGVPVRIELRSDDVIHSFWVPKLAGKTDVIPGQANRMWIEAQKPGIYRGQCTEYCGLEHALMGLRVIADPPAEFAAWRTRQLRGTQIRDGVAAAGARVFAEHCSACHAIHGTGFGGGYGPDLTNLGERRTLAAGTLDNTTDNLRRWIAHAQEVKPGARMPDVPLAPNDVGPLVAYLEGR